MKNLIALLILSFLAACAPNPLNLTKGMWVKHKIDGQKYFIINLNPDEAAHPGGLVRVKNEFGVEVDKDFAIFEFDLWVEPAGEKIDRGLGRLIEELTAARKALQEVNGITPDAERVKELEKVISDGEKTGVFAPKKWNPETEQYE